MLACALIILTSVAPLAAGDLPDAPSNVMSATPAPAIAISPPITQSKGHQERVEKRIIDKTFVTLAVISTGSAFSDSYTTLFARENWLAGKQNVCNVEAQSPYLYGTHPTVARTYAVASVKSAGSIAASYFLRKHHSKLWSLPLIANSVFSLQGTTQNMIVCN
jgi:hypothetical protein